MKKRLLTVLLALCLVFALGIVTALADDGVAQIGSQTYSSSSEAFSNATDGSEIVLLDEVTGCSRLSLTDGREITINLNGHNIGFAENAFFYVHHGSLTITGTGTVREGNPFYAPVFVEGSETDEGPDLSLIHI